MDVLRELLLPKLEGLRKSGAGYDAKCPAHGDSHASLSVGPGKEHPVVLTCHAGCDRDAVLTALGLTWAELCAPRDNHDPGEWTPRGPAIAIYDYTNEHGELLFQVCRTADKQFPQRRPDSTRKTGWNWKLGDVRRVLYRLPKIIEGIKNGQPIFLVEGERDVQTLERHGLIATCNPGGAGSWRDEYSKHLADADVTIVADRDDPGQAHARHVAAALTGVTAQARIVEAATGKDAADHFAAGHTVNQFIETWNDHQPPKVDLAPDLWEFIGTEDPPYDWIVPNLLERGDRLVWTGFEGLGKAVDVTTPIPIPLGWSTMGELSVGDEVFSPDGSITRVVAATRVMRGRPCYRITFSDGTQIVADEQHLWLTETLPAREAAARQTRRGPTKLRGTDQRHLRVHIPKVVTTGHIAATLRARDGHAANHSVACSAPLDPPPAVLPIPPYLLGMWLSDGTTRGGILTLNREDASAVEERIGIGSHRVPSGERPGSVTVRVDGLQATLHATGLLGYKHIPTAYTRGSAEQRWELLAGLLDGDGHIVVSTGTGRGSGAATCELTLCDKQLASDALELMWSLGIKVTSYEYDAMLNGRVVGRRWRMHFQTSRNPFRIPRKANRWAPLRTRRATLRYITAVEPVESVPVRCIKVDRADGMFVVGRECIPTHNSMFIRQLAVTVAAGLDPFDFTDIPPQHVLLIDCENSERQARRRFRPLAARSITAQRRVPDGALHLIHRPEGLDLTRDDDAAWLMERVTAHVPDLLIVGPFYQLHAANINEEQAARRTVAVLNAARTRVDCALVIEAHAGHGEQGKNRSVRPVGSSLLMRWPEFGYGITPAVEPDGNGRVTDVHVKRWRGDRDERNWPTRLVWGDHWPWIPKTSTTPQNWPSWSEPDRRKDLE
jgi:hypothetical protein